MGKFVTVAKKQDVRPGTGFAVNVEDKKIAIFNVDGTYYAIENRCSHIGAPLADGMIYGDEVTCPWHGATFKIPTGEIVCPPAFRPLICYNVKLVGDEIQLEI